MMRTDDLTRILRERLAATHVEVVDESAEHVGHAAAQQSGGDHFAVVIVADQFTGKSLVDRHRAVYEALRAELQSAIHALKIKAHSPAEWAARSS